MTRLTVFATLIVATLLSMPSASADTIVGGFISTDTTWDPSGNPHIAASSVLVEEGVTLTILPGVEVRFDPVRGMQVDGTLVAAGTAQAPVIFTSNAVTPAPGNWGGILFTGSSEGASFDPTTGGYVSGSTIQYTLIEYVMEGINAATPAAGPFIDSNVVQFFTDRGFRGRQATVINSVFRNDPKDYNGTGINLSEGGFLSGNVLTGVRIGILRASGDKLDGFGNNLILQCRWGVIIANYFLPLAVTANTVTANIVGMVVEDHGGNVVITANNIFRNVSPNSTLFNLEAGRQRNPPEPMIAAQGNWWGLTSEAAIADTIHDFFDDVRLQVVDFTPFLTSPNLDAPIWPPATHSLVATSGASISVTWDSVEVPDRAGYLLYYDTDGSDFPYTGTGAAEGTSPIDVGDVTSFTLTGLDPGTAYWVAVTAYDADCPITPPDNALLGSICQVGDLLGGHESWFSEEVQALTCVAGQPCCGNSVLEAGEECDGSEDSACPGRCHGPSEQNPCQCEPPPPQLCGNGQIDGDEGCDGANLHGQTCESLGFLSGTLACAGDCTFNTSGCTPDPCPNGVLDIGEECDDGNSINGDGCSTTCESELIPGGGRSRSDCVAEWLVVPEPVEDAKTGFPTYKVTCRDNDPCDFDGGVFGSCRFRVALCINEAERRFACSPTNVARYQLNKPRPDSRKPAERAAAAVLLPAIQGLGASIIEGARENIVRFGPSLTARACSAFAEIDVPLKIGRRGAKQGKLVLKGKGWTSERVKDADTLKLICLP